MTNTNGYENAPATKILATHCAACGRPLLDSVSVEIGMGPDCRKKYMGKATGHSDEARAEANQLVHQIAIAVSHSSVAEVLSTSQALDRLRSLGFDKLADKLELSWVKVRIEERDGMMIVVSPYDEAAVAAAQRIPGRRWNRDAKCNEFPVSAKPAVWAMLRRYYAGMAGSSSHGTFVIPPLAA